MRFRFYYTKLNELRERTGKLRYGGSEIFLKMRSENGELMYAVSEITDFWYLLWSIECVGIDRF